MHNTFINNKCKKIEILSEKVSEMYSEIYFDDTPNYRELITLVKSMSQEYFLPLMLYADGYKYQEIAENLGISIGTVKSRIHSARQRLKKMLQ